MTLKEFREVTEKISEDTVICFNNAGLFEDTSTTIVEGVFMRLDVDTKYLDIEGNTKMADVIIFD